MRSSFRRLVAAGLIACWAAGASAAVYFPPQTPDLSGYATTGQVSALQSQIPQPGSTVPPAEVVGGAPGSAASFRRADAIQPRITRSNTVTLDATGAATFDWTSQGALATPVQVIISPVSTSTASIPICYATAVSATATSIKCTMVSTANITLALVTAGLNLFGTSAAGMQVGIVALPKS